MTNAVKHEDLVINYDEYHVEWYVNGSRKGKKKTYAFQSIPHQKP